MPLYTYACDEHGEFDVHCSVRFRNEDKPCPGGPRDNSEHPTPECGELCPRAGVEMTQSNDHKGDPRVMSHAQLTREGR